MLPSATLATLPMPKPCSSAPTRIATAGPRMSLHVKITNYESGKSDEEQLYEVSQKGTDKTYVEFMSPRDKGRHLLMLGDDMWIYLPDTSRPVRITPLERLSGDASNGDVARTNYAVDYTAAYVSAHRKGRRRQIATSSTSTAKRKGATYQRILYWLRVEDARPVRAEFYLTSGKHIKSATFDEYAPSGGKMLLHRLTLYDEIRHNSHSVLEYSNAVPRDLARQALLPGPRRQVLIHLVTDTRSCMRHHPLKPDRKENKVIGNIRKSTWFVLLPALCCSLFILLGQYSYAQTPKTGKLTIKITGIRNAEGNIRVSVRTDENTIVDSKAVEIDSKTLTAEAVFDNLPEGNYGVAVIHDENKNEKLDFNDAGMPIEGYGHSNNPAKRPGPPNFDETKFAFAAPGSAVNITLIYWP